MSQPDELLSAQSAADLLGVKTQTLAIWRCKKRYSLRYIKVGSCVRYRRSEIERFLSENTSAPVKVRTR